MKAYQIFPDMVKPIRLFSTAVLATILFLASSSMAYAAFANDWLVHLFWVNSVTNTSDFQVVIYPEPMVGVTLTSHLTLLGG